MSERIAATIPTPLHNEAPTNSLEAKDLRHLLHPSTNLRQLHENGPTIFVRGKGLYLWDNKGRQYLDGMGGLWCTALGYGEEELIRAAEQQMRKLSYSQLYAGNSNEPSILLAEKLKSMMPFDAGRVFFGLSGSDANDTQIKLMWYYNNALGRHQKKKIISRRRAYHGVTIASGSLTGLPVSHKSFDLPIAGFLHTDTPNFYREGLQGEGEEEFATRLAGNLDALIVSEGPDTVAAFIAEPIMGGAGVVPPPATYFEKVQAVLAKHDVLFIDDEVICGFGRTGTAFGATTYGFTPNTMTVAKALTSAYMPLSAVIIPEFMYEAYFEASKELGTFGHGFTYSGHPVSTAVGLRTLELMEERNIFAYAAKMGAIFQARMRALASHPLVGDTRGAGLLGGVELVANKATKAAFELSRGVGPYCQSRCMEHGLILRSIADTMTIAPPLVISEGQIHELFDKLELALNETRDWIAAAH